MREFFRRLKYYAVGFGIGLVFVFFFFQNRGCSWLPANRVKNEFLSRVIVISGEQAAKLQQAGLTEKDVVSFLNSGSVEFGKSKKQGNPQVYEITNEINGKSHSLWFVLPRNAFVAEVKVPEGSIQAEGNSVSGTGKMVHFPNVINYLYMTDDGRMKCQKKELGITSEKILLQLLKKSGMIDFGLSKLHAAEPVQHLFFKGLRGEPIQSDTRWYQDHVEFSEFQTPDTLTCM